MTPVMSYGCREAFDRIDDFLDRELSGEEMSLVRCHLETCAMCAQEFQFEADLIRSTREKLTHLDLPLDLKYKISLALSKVAHD